MRQRTYRAVLTGDIIGSSRLRPDQMEAVRATLADAADAVRHWKRGLVKGRLEFFRGDGWQLLLTDPAMALRAGIYLRARLLAGGIADSRLAIGVGEGENALSGNLALLSGQAFELSGHALDEMTRYWRMTIELPGSAGPLSIWMRVIGHFCDSLVCQWTRRQAEIICAAIVPSEPDHETIARRLNPAVTKQAVSKALGGANWQVIREALRRFEETPWDSVLRFAQSQDAGILTG